MQRRNALAIFSSLALCLAPLSAQQSAFELSLGTDIALGAAGLGLSALPLLLDPAPIQRQPIDEIPAFDRAFIAPYDGAMDELSSYAAYATLALPATILFFVPSDAETWGGYAAMYGEAFLLTWGLKETLKDCVGRWRPYAYEGSLPAGLEDEYDESFPSGHTALAFMSASFLTATLVFEDAPPEYAIPLSVGSYLVATAIAWLRVDSGNHFPSDVLVGAAIGSAVGWLVPVLHLRGVSGGAQPSVGFGKGMSFSIAFDL